MDCGHLGAALRLLPLLLVLLLPQQSARRIQRSIVQKRDYQEEPPITALIIEPRCHAALALVVANLHSSLPEVPVKLMYSTENEHFVKKELVDLLADHFGEKDKGVQWLSFVPLEGDAFQHGLQNPYVYSKVMVKPSFWEKLTGKKVLVFQTDSWICKDAADKLEHFKDYDYIGAPTRKWFVSSGGVGNGGLSLRTRRVMMKAAKAYDWAHLCTEDTFFAKQVSRSGVGKVAPKGLAHTFFAGEAVLDGESLNPFGLHKVWRHHEGDWSKLLPACPGLDILHSAQSMHPLCGADGVASAKRLLQGIKGNHTDKA